MFPLNGENPALIAAIGRPGWIKCRLLNATWPLIGNRRTMKLEVGNCPANIRAAGKYPYVALAFWGTWIALLARRIGDSDPIRGSLTIESITNSGWWIAIWNVRFLRRIQCKNIDRLLLQSIKRKNNYV